MAPDFTGWGIGARAMFRPDDKTTARYARDQWKGVRRAATLMLTTAGAAGAKTLAVLAGGLLYYGDKHADAAEALADDPPSKDFERRVVLTMSRLDLDAIGPTPFERRSADVFAALVGGTALIRGTVRAVERAAGGVAAGASQQASERLLEAREFAAEAQPSLIRLEMASMRAAEGLLSEGSEVEGPVEVLRPASWRRDERLDARLSPEALSELYRLGVPISALRIPAEDLLPYEYSTARPAEQLSSALQKAGVASRRLGEQLGDWQQTMSGA